MCRSEHHHHTNNTRKQRTQQNTTPQPERGAKETTREPRRRHQRCATPKAATRCKLKWPPELLQHGLSPSSRTHTIIDPSAPFGSLL